VREHEAEGGGDDEDGKGDEASEPDREERPCRVLRDRERGTGHTNLGVTSIYLQGIDNAEIIATVHARKSPMIPASTELRL
jgi:hypothetical protein